MDGSSSAPAPHQVSVITCGFPDPTSAIMARAHSSLDSPRFGLAEVCRLRNDVVVMPRELLQITHEHHEHAPLGAAAVQIKYPCCRQLVSSAGPPKIGVMVPYQIITAVCCVWISACAQEALPAPISSSAYRSLRLADRR